MLLAFLNSECLNDKMHNIDYCFSDYKYDKIQCECLKCLRAIMNSTVGVKQMFSQKEALTIVAQSLDANKPTVMLEAVRVLAAVCLIPPDGHERVIEAITMSGEMRRLTNRFQPVVDALLKGNPQLRVSFTRVTTNKCLQYCYLKTDQKA